MPALNQHQGAGGYNERPHLGRYRRYKRQSAFPPSVEKAEKPGSVLLAKWNLGGGFGMRPATFLGGSSISVLRTRTQVSILTAPSCNRARLHASP